MALSSLAPTERAASMPMPVEGPLRLAVVADTHSAMHPAAKDLLRAGAPHAILHAGDVGRLEVLSELEAIAPLFAIRGNIDVRAPELPDVLTLDVVDAGAVILRILLLHIAVHGPRLRADARRLAKTKDAQLVVCGHSHVPLIAEDRGVAIFNPGSVGPRRFRLPIVFGAVEVARAGVRLAHVDCETGNPWHPAAARVG